jgi:AraC-like DNA-binding protein
VPVVPSDHDRVAAVPDRDPGVVPGGDGAGGPGGGADQAAVVDAVLSGLRLSGAIFLRAEYGEAWAYESMSTQGMGRVLDVDPEHLVLFHVVASGRCWVEVEGGERLWADAGDVIVIPYGDRHRMGGEADAELVPIERLLAPPPWTQMPVIRHGGPGPTTGVVCGYLRSDDPLLDRRTRLLPAAFVVRPSEGGAVDWVRSSIEYALARTTLDDVGRIAAPPRLPELLLVEMLRIHLGSSTAPGARLVRALHDPVLGPALTAIHADPGRRWTVADLAATSHVSVSALDERFREVLGVAPIRYVFGWRMHRARELLAARELGVAAVARRVGYESEEAFSRAFRREHGVAPSQWHPGS